MASGGGSPRRTVTATSGRQGRRSARCRKCLFTAPQDNVGGRKVGVGGAITERVREHLRQSFASVMVDFGGELSQMDGEDDHVHLLVSFPPKYSVATLVNSLKGVSARLLRQRNFPEVRRKLWGTHFFGPRATLRRPPVGRLSPPSSATSRTSALRQNAVCRAALHPGPKRPGFRAVLLR